MREDATREPVLRCYVLVLPSLGRAVQAALDFNELAMLHRCRKLAVLDATGLGCRSGYETSAGCCYLYNCFRNALLCGFMLQIVSYCSMIHHKGVHRCMLLKSNEKNLAHLRRSVSALDEGHGVPHNWSRINKYFNKNGADHIRNPTGT